MVVAEGRSRRILILLLMIQLLFGAISFANADGLDLRQQIMEKLQATPKPKQNSVTNAPTPKPTKRTTSPTLKPTKPNPTPIPTKATSAPTLHKTKSPTSAPAKKAAVTAIPTKKTSKSPTAKPTSAQAAAKTTSSSPTRKSAKSPSETKGNAKGTPTSSSPSKAKTTAPTTGLKSSLIATVPSNLTTNSPTGSLLQTEAPSSSSAAPTVSTSSNTAAPSDTVEFPTPTTAPSSVSKSPSTAASETVAPSSSEDSSVTATPTASPTVWNVTNPPETTSPTSSPTTAQSNDVSVETPIGEDSNVTTASPSSAPITTQPPTEGTSSPSSVALNAFNISMSNAAAPLFNWTAQAQYQLYLVKVTGISSRAAAGNAILALKRMCTQRTDDATAELTLALQEITSTVLPELKSNRSSCDELLKYQEAQSDRPTRERLEYASASAAMAIKAQERLVDISQVVLSENGTTSCAALVNPQVTELRQYDVQTEMDSINTANIVLASLALVLSLILMVMHPLIDGWGSMAVFVVAASYVWGYAAFMAGWYAFQLNEVSAWVASTWWRDFYSVYLMGLAAWLLFLCLFAMIYFILRIYSWLMGVLAGITVGAVLGVQVNTIGVWQLGYSAQLPEYFTHACCMGVGAGLLAIAFAFLSGFAPTAGGMQHITAMFVGSYLFIKSIGVLAGSYPNEFDMEPPQAWETYVYISAMWLLFIICLIFQTFVYGIFAPLQRPSGPRKQPTAPKRKEYTEEEKIPLLTEPVGAASDSRNRLRQQEVMEFGGIRALRSEQENRKLYV